MHMHDFGKKNVEHCALRRRNSLTEYNWANVQVSFIYMPEARTLTPVDFKSKANLRDRADIQILCTYSRIKTKLTIYSYILITYTKSLFLYNLLPN